jgi:DNA polymerase-1
VAGYAETDAELTWRLKQVLEPLLLAEELHTVAALESELIYPVCHMESAGVLLNVGLLEQWIKESETALNNCLWQVSKSAGFAVNPDSSIDWTRLFKRLGIPITTFTETGAPSFTDAVLRGIDNDTVQAARRAGKLASLRAKYLLPYSKAIDEKGILRYQLHQLRADEHGTVSGRFSSSDCNIQQVIAVSKQKEAFSSDEFLIRRLFIPQNGKWLCSDAMQIEYRLFGHYSNSQKILEAYAADPLLNYHRLTHESLKTLLPDVTYDRAKTLNFCLLYGGGKEKVAQLLSLPRVESDEFVVTYYRLFPEIRTLLRKAADLATSRGYVKTLLGRRARFPDAAFTHKALNRVIQGSAADALKMKIVELHRERKQTGFLMRFVVHDEFDGDSPDEKAAEAVREILNRQTLPTKVPILYEVGLGVNWAEAK